ncbi:hypothetical protein HpCHC82_19980 [Helicobacter pylori]
MCLVSEHITQIHAIEPSVFEFSPHKGIVVRVNGRDFAPKSLAHVSLVSTFAISTPGKFLSVS